MAQKTKTKIDDLLIEVFKGIRPPFYVVISLYIAIQWLVVPDIVYTILFVFIVIFIIYEIISAIQKVIDFIMLDYIDKVEKEEGKKKNIAQTKHMIKVIQFVTKLVIWFIGSILILSNLGINVTSLIASLGIGGIAVALAAQNILSDLFSSFSIYVDKPFEVGDLITIGTDTGTIEKIGMKTTRLKTLQGEELVVSNRELTTVRIQNFKKLQKRRGKLFIGIPYGTPAKKLKKVPQMLKNIILNVQGMEFGRCHFSEYGDSSLIFEAVYYVQSSEYSVFMDKKQELHLELYKTFEEEGIGFAYPSQSVYIESMPKTK